MTKTFSFQQIAVPKVLSEEVREAISNNVLQFYVRDQQQEAQDEGITALYERLSQEDKLEGESNSIANQKKILERYCREHGITAYRHYDEDDGYSGTNFNRPGFQSLIAAVEAGEVDIVCVKDMSRFGRNSSALSSKICPVSGVIICKSVSTPICCSPILACILSRLMTELTVRGAKTSLPQSATCSTKCMPAILQRRYALLGNQKVNPANILPQSRLTAT